MIDYNDAKQMKAVKAITEYSEWTLFKEYLESLLEDARSLKQIETVEDLHRSKGKEEILEVLINLK